MNKFIGLLAISFMAGIFTTNPALAYTHCVNSSTELDGGECGLALPCVWAYPDEKVWGTDFTQKNKEPACTVNGNSVLCGLYPTQSLIDPKGFSCGTFDGGLTATCANGIKQETVSLENNWLGTLYSCN